MPVAEQYQINIEAKFVLQFKAGSAYSLLLVECD